MCGFLGKVSTSRLDSQLVEKCNNFMKCRGPDETKFIEGKINEIFSSKNEKYISFYFNRLAILDLTPKASQPMVSKRFNTTVMFNGEIFNHKELRETLENEGVEFFSSHSDTEVVLNGLSYFGLDFISKLEGQFSIMFFDPNVQKVFLIRDRLGQKPLFYSYNNEELVFSSSLKSLSLLEKNTKINDKSLVDYLDYGVVPSPNTIFENIYKLSPAEIIEFDISKNVQITNKLFYWNIKDKIDYQLFSKEKFDNLLSESVSKRLDADVPMAVFLSGGIDSSTIVKQLDFLNKDLNTFSVGYSDPKYDESKWINLVSNTYSTTQKTVQLSKNDINSSIQESIDIFDEPYSDPSTVPSYVISKAISEEYKVAISGDGGDELLYGYERSKFMSSRNFLMFNSNLLNKYYPDYFGTGNNFSKYDKFFDKAYSSFFSDKKFLNLLGLESNFTFENKFFQDLDNPYKSSIVIEYNFFLSEMMMLKVDTTSMANSLEIRSPFVDHKLVEYIVSLNTDCNSKTFNKVVLKDILEKDMGTEFINRKKMGFVFNLESWIYSNIDDIFEIIEKSNLNISKSELNLLSRFKSRINSQRIWRIYFLVNYLDWFNKKI